MNNSENYKKTYSAFCPSDEAIERTMNMTNKSNKKIKIKPVLAVSACLILLVAGLFGGSAISARINNSSTNNLFILKAYANGHEISFNDSPVINTDLQLQYTDSTNDKGYSVLETSQGFRIEGTNIKTVTYKAEHGIVSYETSKSSDVKAETQTPAVSELPYSSALTLEISKDEAVVVWYDPEEAIDTMLASDEKMSDLSTLPTDTITVNVNYRDGSSQQAKIKTSFDKNGKMQLEYTEL